MTCSNIYDLKKIPIYYEELRGKKLFTKALSEIDVNKKSVHLFYYKNANIPICALPKLGVVIISKRGLDVYKRQQLLKQFFLLRLFQLFQLLMG